MLTFETYEIIENDGTAIKKPIPIGFKQINEPFRVNSLEGDYAQGQAGDYLMTGIKGEHYICRKDIFEECYDYTGVIEC